MNNINIYNTVILEDWFSSLLGFIPSKNSWVEMLPLAQQHLLTNRLVALLPFTAPYHGTPFTPEVSCAASLKEIHDLLNEIIFTSSNIKEVLKLKSQLDN